MLTLRVRGVRRGSTRRSQVGGFALLLAALLQVGANAAEPVSDGQIIPVPSLITTPTVNRIRGKADQVMAEHRTGGGQAAPSPQPLSPAAGERGRGEGARLVIIFDFNPGGRPGNARDYEACRTLARYIDKELANVETVAFVHGEVTRHSVMPVLACRTIFMSKNARLGDIYTGGGQPRRSPDQPATWDDQEIKYVQTAPTYFIGQCLVMPVVASAGVPLGASSQVGAAIRVADLDSIALSYKTVAEGRRPKEFVRMLGQARGKSDYNFDEASELGLCEPKPCADQQSLFKQLGISPESTPPDVLLDSNPVAWRVDVRGVVDEGLKGSLERRIGTVVVDRRATHLILQIECSGGSFDAARDLALFLSELKVNQSQRRVTTIAYLPNNAPDTAAIVALGCTHIVMKQGATFGDWSSFAQGDRKASGVNPEARPPEARPPEARPPEARPPEARLSPGQLEDLERLLKNRHVDPALARGMMDVRGVMTAEEARERGIVNHVLDPHASLNDVYAHYGLEAERVQVVRSDWLDGLVTILTHPIVTVLLVMGGIIGLILEFKLPGVTLPGIIAALCFVLFFWSRSQVAGNIAWLAALLFVLGLILLAVEVFVLPGFGAPAICGVLLLIGSLVLVICNTPPGSSAGSWSTGSTLAVLGVGMAAAIIGAFVLASYLPQIPYVNRLILTPQTEQEPSFPGSSLGTRDIAEVPRFAALLGAIGMTATPLRPAGKVAFGDELVDVVTEGDFVEEGTRVRVIEIEGNRVVVKQVVSAESERMKDEG